MAGALTLAIPGTATPSAGVSAAGYNSLLPFIEKLTQKLPQRWDNRLKRDVPNDDWLLWELNEPKGGDTVRAVHESEL